MMRLFTTGLLISFAIFGNAQTVGAACNEVCQQKCKAGWARGGSPVTTSASVCGQKRTLRVKRAGNTLTAFASAATPGPALGLEAPTIVFSATLVPDIPRLAEHAAGAVPLAASLQPTADVAYARQVGVV